METRFKKRRLESLNGIGYKHIDCGYIVKLKILGENNENRKNIADPIYASYRCSEAEVLDIFHWETGEKIDFICSPFSSNSLIDYFNEDIEEKRESVCSLFSSNFIYIVGKIVKSNFDKNLENVNSTGIHYYKTLEQAILYLKKDSYLYEGKLITYYDNGNKHKEGYIKNKYWVGRLKIYNQIGEKLTEQYYENGSYLGHYKSNKKYYMK